MTWKRFPHYWPFVWKIHLWFPSQSVMRSFNLFPLLLARTNIRVTGIWDAHVTSMQWSWGGDPYKGSWWSVVPKNLQSVCGVTVRQAQLTMWFQVVRIPIYISCDITWVVFCLKSLTDRMFVHQFVPTTNRKQKHQNRTENIKRNVR